jgi:hypothetical protein
MPVLQLIQIERAQGGGFAWCPKIRQPPLSFFEWVTLTDGEMEGNGLAGGKRRKANSSMPKCFSGECSRRWVASSPKVLFQHEFCRIINV